MIGTWDSTCTNTQSWTVDDILKAVEKGKKIGQQIQEDRQKVRAYLYQYIEKSGESWKTWAERMHITENELRYYCYIAPENLVPSWFYDSIRRLFYWNELKRLI